MREYMPENMLHILRSICQIECQNRCPNRCQIYFLKCHGGYHSKSSNILKLCPLTKVFNPTAAFPGSRVPGCCSGFHCNKSFTSPTGSNLCISWAILITWMVSYIFSYYLIFHNHNVVQHHTHYKPNRTWSERVKHPINHRLGFNPNSIILNQI